MQAVKLKMASVANIGKITKAMQMVAASKLRGAESRALAARPMTGALKDLFGSLEKSEENPDGVVLTPKTELVIPVTSDKGLCGGVNTLLVKMVRMEYLPTLTEAGVDFQILSVGDKGRSVLRRLHPDELAGAITNAFQAIPPNFSVASTIADVALEQDKDQVTIAFQTFRSVINQEPTLVKIPSYKLIAEGAETDPFMKFETEDERQETFENFCEFNLAVALYGAMLENNCSEIASRIQPWTTQPRMLTKHLMHWSSSTTRPVRLQLQLSSLRSFRVLSRSKDKDNSWAELNPSWSSE